MKTFSASLENLHGMLHFIKQQAKSEGFSNDMMGQIEVAVEEALVNIIRYGYPNQNGDIGIHCLITDSRELIITIKDQGIPHNPSDSKGLGLHLIEQIMDEMHYKRDRDNNILTLVKKNHQTFPG